MRTRSNSKIQNSFQASFRNYFLLIFFPLPLLFSSFFFLVPRAEAVDDAKLFPSDMNSERNRANVEPVAYRSNYAFQLHANMASCRHSFCAYLHTPPRCYPPFSSLLPSKSHALYAFRKTARTCLEEYAVFRGFHSIFTRGILSTRGKFSKSFVN